jgi:HEPN domain-containing protein
MTQEELRLEIVRTIYPVYKDITQFKRIANEVYNWVAPEGLPTEKDCKEFVNSMEEFIEEANKLNNEIPEGYKKGPGGRLFPIDKTKH